MKRHIALLIVCLSCCLSCVERTTSPSTSAASPLSIDTGDGVSIPVSAMFTCSYADAMVANDTIEHRLVPHAMFVDQFGAFVNCDSVSFNGSFMTNNNDGTTSIGQYFSVSPILDQSQRPRPMVKAYNYLGNDLELPFELAPRFDVQGNRKIDTVSISRGLTVTYASWIPQRTIDVSLTFDASASEGLLGSIGRNGSGWLSRKESDDGTISLSPADLQRCTPYRIYEFSLQRNRDSVYVHGTTKIGLSSIYEWTSYIFLVP